MTSQGQVLADLEVGNGSTMYSAGHTEKRPHGTEDFTWARSTNRSPQDLYSEILWGIQQISVSLCLGTHTVKWNGTSGPGAVGRDGVAGTV